MIKRKVFQEDEQGKFSVGEEVYSKDNTNLKMTVFRCSGMRYYCGAGEQKSENERMFFEDDLISEWQIPFFK